MTDASQIIFRDTQLSHQQFPAPGLSATFTTTSWEALNNLHDKLLQTALFIVIMLPSLFFLLPFLVSCHPPSCILLHRLCCLLSLEAYRGREYRVLPPFRFWLQHYGTWKHHKDLNLKEWAINLEKIVLLCLVKSPSVQRRKGDKNSMNKHRAVG